MLVATLVLVGLLAFGPQAVLCNFDSISFSSIAQCGSFNVSFNGGKPPKALPLTLTVLPFNSTPISIPIPPSSWDDATSTGAYVTFLPLAAGTSLIASLDDADGDSAGSVSDIIKIEPSDNSSCLPSTIAPPTAPAFSLLTPVTQCENFNVSFDASLESEPPSVRVFIRQGPSFNIPQNLEVESDPDNLGTYLMNATRGQQLALLFDDGKGRKEVSDIFTVEGDAASSLSCLVTTPKSTMASSDSNMSQGLSRETIIIILVSSIVIFATILFMALIFLRRELRRRRTLRDKGFSNTSIEAGRPMSRPSEKMYGPERPTFAAPAPARVRPESRPDPPQEGRYLMDPPYPAEQFDSSASPSPVAALTLSRTITSSLFPPLTDRARSLTPSTRPVSSIDIEGILEMASARSPMEAQFANALPSPESVFVFPRSPPSAGRSPGLLGARSMQTLDVPKSATPSGRFSGLSDMSHTGVEALARGDSAGNRFIDPNTPAGRRPGGLP